MLDNAWKDFGIRNMWTSTQKCLIWIVIIQMFDNLYPLSHHSTCMSKITRPKIARDARKKLCYFCLSKSDKATKWYLEDTCRKTTLLAFSRIAQTRWCLLQSQLALISRLENVQTHLQENTIFNICSLFTVAVVMRQGCRNTLLLTSSGRKVLWLLYLLSTSSVLGELTKVGTGLNPCFWERWTFLVLPCALLRQMPQEALTKLPHHAEIPSIPSSRQWRHPTLILRQKQCFDVTDVCLVRLSFLTFKLTTAAVTTTGGWFLCPCTERDISTKHFVAPTLWI